MAKAESVNIDDLLTPEQRVEGQSMADLYFLAVPRQTLEELNKAAKARGMTLAEALAQAVEGWLEGASHE